MIRKRTSSLDFNELIKRLSINANGTLINTPTTVTAITTTTRGSRRTRQVAFATCPSRCGHRSHSRSWRGCAARCRDLWQRWPTWQMLVETFIIMFKLWQKFRRARPASVCSFLNSWPSLDAVKVFYFFSFAMLENTLEMTERSRINLMQVDI